MWSNFIQFIKAILNPLWQIAKIIDSDFAWIISICIIFLVALALKRGVKQ